ncbi:MAG TPA: hypothetical protein VNN07_02000 [Candidatus Tectomicrobia bacterium]|nr:hypothetical protein [Candidatus Tectomicrobia bacterium]
MNTQSRRIRRFVTASFLVLVLAPWAQPAAGAALEDTVLPADRHTSPKAQSLATRHADALRAVSIRVYHCMPWVEIKKHGIGFYKPKHLAGDVRYLSINLFIDQQPSPEFSAYTVEERASRMFSRYVGPMVRRLAANGVLHDPDLDGFTVILEWLKQVPANGARPVHETIAAFIDKGTADQYVAGRLPAHDLASHVRVLGWDGETALGPLRLVSWEDDFVRTYRVQDYQLAPGISCD